MAFSAFGFPNSVLKLRSDDFSLLFFFLKKGFKLQKRKFQNTKDSRSDHAAGGSTGKE